MSSRHAIQATVCSLLLICSSTAMADTGAPSPPSGLTASATSCKRVELTWAASSHSGSAELFGYKVYRNGSFLKWALAVATSTVDSTAAGATTYTYTVAALNNDGKLSEESTAASVTTPDCSPAPSGPTAPMGLSASASTCNAVELSWNTPSQSGSAGLLAYRMFRDGSFLKWVFPLATSTEDPLVSAGATYAYMVEALNNVGELSPPSAPTSVLVPPCTSGAYPPSPPTGLAASATDCGTIMLSWKAPSNGGTFGVAGYKVYRDGALLKEVQAPATSTFDNGLAAGATHVYAVSAVDDGNNESDPSSPGSATTPACTNLPPIADAGPDQFTQSLTTISFDGSGCSDPDGLLTSYAWNFGDGHSASGVSVSHAYSAANTYTVMLTVSDNGGLTASDTATVQVSNRPPVANAGPDKTAQAGATLGLDGSGSSDPDGSIVSYSWAFGDGASASGATVSHSYSEPGDYVVTLVVRDNKGQTDSDTAGVTVTEAFSGGGEFRWARHFGNTGMDVGEAVATDSSGNVVVTGRVLGTVDLGGGATCSESIFVAKYAAEGGHLWSRCFGGLGGGSGMAIATDSNDDVLMTGYFTGTVDFGGSLLTSAGGADVFVAKYTESGEHLWSSRFGSPTLGAFIKESGNAIALDPSGNVVVTGIFEGTAEFGGVQLTSVGQTDIFVAKYSAGGQPLWAKSFGDRGSYDSGNAVATDGSGNVLMAGSFAGNVDFGGGPLTGAGSTVFVAKYSPNGTHLWSQSFGGSSSDSARSIAVDSSGDLILAGVFENTVDFGGGPLTSAGKDDIFVAKYSPTGAHHWARQFGSAGSDDAGNAVTLDESGNVVVAGFFMGTVDFGGGPLVGASSTEIFVAKYTNSGAHMWSHRFGARSAQEANAVALSDSSVFVSGIFARAVDFGGGSLQSAGGTDVFLLCLEP